MMTHKISSIGILTALLTVSLSHGIALADISGKHPYYLHARSDLRKAEILLQHSDESNVVQETKIAYQNVHNAIREIDRAAVYDRKDVDDNPPVDNSIAHLDRLRAIYKLLRSAEKDISREEDNRSAVGLRNRAEANINQAKRRIEIAVSRDVVDDLRNDRY
ncbi:MAG: hypothetical protein V7L22_33490 [Nostoc sp.]|uniref:hypothetical protein n=1 Tax=Nostoc sp. TaxID=1180 RepID=UPI002FF880BE